MVNRWRNHKNENCLWKNIQNITKNEECHYKKSLGNNQKVIDKKLLTDTRTISKLILETVGLVHSVVEPSASSDGRPNKPALTPSRFCLAPNTGAILFLTEN